MDVEIASWLPLGGGAKGVIWMVWVLDSPVRESVWIVGWCVMAWFWRFGVFAVSCASKGRDGVECVFVVVGRDVVDACVVCFLVIAWGGFRCGACGWGGDWPPGPGEVGG